MERHILLTYLSDVKKSGNRLALPVIYKEFNTQEHPDWGNTQTTNEAAVLYLNQKGIVLDKIFAFASEKVEKDVLEVTDTEAQGKTSLEYFRQRIAKLPAVWNIGSVMPWPDPKDEETTIVSCGEISDDMPKIMNFVRQMAGLMIFYKTHLDKDAKDAGKEADRVILHIDLTGGPRNAVMMSMALMQLMKYFGITIGNVIYGSLVWDSPTDQEKKMFHISQDKTKIGRGTIVAASELNDIFDLVSGVNEFKKYGSVDTLTEYFSRPTTVESEHVKELLSGMNRFANAIRITQPSVFNTVIIELKDALEAFDKNVGDESRKRKAEGKEDELSSPLLNDFLMQILIHPIMEEYGDMLGKEKDELVPITWCLQHQYIQQAMTLYVETVPDYLEHQGILQLTETQKKWLERKKKEFWDPNFTKKDIFFLINHVQSPMASLSAEESEAFVESIKIYVDVLEDMRQHWYLTRQAENRREGIFSKEILEKLIQHIEDTVNHTEQPVSPEGKEHLKKVLQTLLDIVGRTESPVYSEETPFQYPALRAFLGQLTAAPGKNKNLWSFIYKKLIHEFSTDQFVAVFLNDTTVDEQKACRETIKDDKRTKSMYWLIHKGHVTLAPGVDEKIFFKMLAQYAQIRDWRNSSAHADGKELSNDEIFENMKICIGNMENGIRSFRKMAVAAKGK